MGGGCEYVIKWCNYVITFVPDDLSNISRTRNGDNLKINKKLKEILTCILVMLKYFLM